MRSLSLSVLYVLFSSVVLGTMLMGLINWVVGEDLAGMLASSLKLGNGIIVAALLGGFTGLWLALGGPKRAAWLAGTMLGLVVAWVLWANGQNYAWVIESFLRGVFGKEAGAYSGLVSTMILFGALGWTTQTTSGLIEGLIQKLRQRAQGGSAPKLEVANNNAT